MNSFQPGFQPGFQEIGGPRILLSPRLDFMEGLSLRIGIGGPDARPELIRSGPSVGVACTGLGVGFVRGDEEGRAERV
jgi:hypothetical protein